MIFSSYVHIRTFILVKRILQGRIQKLSIPSMETTTNGCSRETTTTEQSKQNRITRMTSFMLISLYVCYLPRVFLYAVWYYEVVTYGRSNHYTDTFGIVAHMLGSIRTLINPILYYHSMEVLRKTIRKIFSCGRNSDKEWESEHRTISMQISTISKV